MIREKATLDPVIITEIVLRYNDGRSEVYNISDLLWNRDVRRLFLDEISILL